MLLLCSAEGSAFPALGCPGTTFWSCPQPVVPFNITSQSLCVEGVKPILEVLE